MAQRCLFIDSENNATLRDIVPEPGAHCFRLDRKYLCYATADHPQALPIWVTVGRARYEIRNVESAAGTRIPAYREILPFSPEAEERGERSAPIARTVRAKSPDAGKPITREEAWEIAEQYMARHPEGERRRIRKVATYDEIVAASRPPRPYARGVEDLRMYWIVYLEMPTGVLGSSEILLVSRIDGQVAFHGSANDEG